MIITFWHSSQNLLRSDNIKSYSCLAVYHYKCPFANKGIDLIGLEIFILLCNCKMHCKIFLDEVEKSARELVPSSILVGVTKDQSKINKYLHQILKGSWVCRRMQKTRNLDLCGHR